MTTRAPTGLALSGHILSGLALSALALAVGLVAALVLTGIAAPAVPGTGLVLDFTLLLVFASLVARQVLVGMKRMAGIKGIAATAILLLLVLSNPLMLVAASDPSLVAMMAALCLFWRASDGLQTDDFMRAGTLTALAFALLAIASAYSLPFLPALVIGLFIIMPRRLLRRDTGGFLIILLLPLFLSLVSLAYLGLTTGLPRAGALLTPQAWFMAQDTLPGASLWQQRHDTHLIAWLANILIWLALIAPGLFYPFLPATMTRGRQATRSRRVERRLGVYRLTVFMLTGALLFVSGLPLSPFVLFGAMLTLIPDMTGKTPPWLLVSAAALSWIAGLMAVWLYAA